MRRRQRQVTRGSIILLIIGAIIVIPGSLLVGFVTYGWSNRPIVDYALDTYQEELSAYGGQRFQFSCDVQNRGPTDMIVQIGTNATDVLLAFNATSQGYPAVAYTDVTVLANGGWTHHLFSIVLADNLPSSFSISCSVTKVADYSNFSHIIATVFGEIGHDSYRITATYVKTSQNYYQES